MSPIRDYNLPEIWPFICVKFLTPFPRRVRQRKSGDGPRASMEEPPRQLQLQSLSYCSWSRLATGLAQGYPPLHARSSSPLLSFLCRITLAIHSRNTLSTV